MAFFQKKATNPNNDVLADMAQRDQKVKNHARELNDVLAETADLARETATFFTAVSTGTYAVSFSAYEEAATMAVATAPRT